MGVMVVGVVVEEEEDMQSVYDIVAHANDDDFGRTCAEALRRFRAHESCLVHARTSIDAHAGEP